MNTKAQTPPADTAAGRCLHALAISLQLHGLRARGFQLEQEQMPSQLRADIAALLNRANPQPQEARS